MNENPAKKIVVVDDDSSIRKTFFLILSEKYLVFPVKDAAEALQRFIGTDIDLVISDFRLPGINGVEMIRKFRQSGYSGEVILISAFPGDLDLDELHNLNIGHYFSKPLDLDALNDSVEFLINSKKWSSKRVLRI